jgi:murein DD-endopeptidase MepM/ murein hydrolase activator NlpD
MIRTPLGTSVYLGHLSDLKISDGQEVTKGQQISSGNVQVGGAYHVHYEYLAQGVTSAGGGKNAGNISPVDIIPGGFNNVINARISV